VSSPLRFLSFLGALEKALREGAYGNIYKNNDGHLGTYRRNLIVQSEHLESPLVKGSTALYKQHLIHI
jgi:hypothetical protein